MEIVDINKNNPLRQNSVNDILEWIVHHEKEGNIEKMVVIIEDSDRNVYSRTVNCKNRDYAYFLMQELAELFTGD